jgi:hypothetical protein
MVVSINAGLVFEFTFSSQVSRPSMDQRRSNRSGITKLKVPRADEVYKPLSKEKP